MVGNGSKQSHRLTHNNRRIIAILEGTALLNPGFTPAACKALFYFNTLNISAEKLAFCDYIFNITQKHRKNQKNWFDAESFWFYHLRKLAKPCPTRNFIHRSTCPSYKLVSRNVV